MKPIVITKSEIAQVIETVNQQCLRECREEPCEVYPSTIENVSRFNYVTDPTEVMLIGIYRNRKTVCGHIAFNRIGTVLSLLLCFCPTVIIGSLPANPDSELINFNSIEETYKWYSSQK